MHKAIWRIANDLRGNVSGWDFTQHVLGLLSHRYISESLAAHFDAGEHEAGNEGLFAHPSELSANVRCTPIGWPVRRGSTTTLHEATELLACVAVAVAVAVVAGEASVDAAIQLPPDLFSDEG